MELISREVLDTAAYKRLEEADVAECLEWFRIIIAGAYYTPDYILEAIRGVMGEIDLDPASCKCAQRRIQAVKFYDEQSNGLVQPWVGRVYLNPNYDFMQFQLFLDKAIEEWALGNMTECILSAETSVTWHKSFHRVLAFFNAYCFVDHRVRWTPAWVGFEHELVEIGFDVNTIPAYSEHGSMFSYMGPNVEKFVEVFGEFGTVLKGVK